jgi:Protein of unknown function (DUF4239)
VKHLDDIPVWLFALLTVASFDAIALGGLISARWLGHRFGLYALLDNNTVGWIFSAILVMYAIAIGLIAIATWGNASIASAAASQEASHIVIFYRILAGYPEPLRSHLTDSVLGYTQSIIKDVWPAQQRGEITEKGTEILLRVGLRILKFEPATEGQSIIHAEALSTFNTLVEFRRRRIEATSYAVPGALWVVVLIGAALAIFASYLFNVESLLAQSLLTTLLASMIALLVFFIATTDHPYRGVNAIRPRAYEIALGNLTGVIAQDSGDS